MTNFDQNSVGMSAQTPLDGLKCEKNYIVGGRGVHRVAHELTSVDTSRWLVKKAFFLLEGGVIGLTSHQLKRENGQMFLGMVWKISRF